MRDLAQGVRHQPPLGGRLWLRPPSGGPFVLRLGTDRASDRSRTRRRVATLASSRLLASLLMDLNPATTLLSALCTSHEPGLDAAVQMKGKQPVSSPFVRRSATRYGFADPASGEEVRPAGAPTGEGTSLLRSSAAGASLTVGDHDAILARYGRWPRRPMPARSLRQHLQTRPQSPIGLGNLRPTSRR